MNDKVNEASRIVMGKIHNAAERLLSAFLVETGLNPSDCAMFHQILTDTPGKLKVKIWYEEKSPQKNNGRLKDLPLNKLKEYAELGMIANGRDPGVVEKWINELDICEDAEKGVLANQQLTGFFHAKNGHSLKDLFDGMGMTFDEWENNPDIAEGLSEKEIEECYGLLKEFFDD